MEKYYLPDFLTENIVKKNIDNIIFEELCISNEVRHLTKKLFKKIKSDVQGKLNRISHEKIGVLNGSFVVGMFGEGITINYKLYFFETEEWFKKFHGREIKPTAVTGRMQMNIEGIIIGDAIQPKLYELLQHEISHIYDMSKRDSDTLSRKYRNLYDKVLFKINNEGLNKIDRDVLFSIYWSFDNEIIANLNGLDAYLTRYSKELSYANWMKVYKVHTTYRIISTIQNILHLCNTNQLSNEYFKTLIDINKNDYVKLIRNGLKKYKAKVGKVLTKFLSEEYSQIHREYFS